jgi:pimeloyl-ACP methyl ester carboxylesterase
MTAHDTYELPRPTGPHAVGRRTIDFVDTTRTDPYLGRPTRELPVTVWYPAAPGTDARPARYLPRGFLLHSLLFGVARAGRIRTHSVVDAAVASGRHPVLLFSPAGWAPYFYGATLEELASHGYVVVGIQHPAEMVPCTVRADGRRTWFRSEAVAGALSVSKGPHADDVRERGGVVDVKADDLVAVLDQLHALQREGRDGLADHLDLERVGVFGHSFGGGAAIAAAQRDDRFRSAANLDGAMWRAPDACRLDRPLLLVLAEHPEMTKPCAEAVEEKFFSSVEWCETDRALHRAAWQSLVDSGRPGSCALIRGARHRSFMDWRLLRLRKWSLGRMDDATIDGHQIWSALTRALRTLFDPTVRGVSSPTLADVEQAVAELEVTTPHDALAPEREHAAVT